MQTSLNLSHEVILQRHICSKILRRPYGGICFSKLMYPLIKWHWVKMSFERLSRRSIVEPVDGLISLPLMRATKCSLAASWHRFNYFSLLGRSVLAKWTCKFCHTMSFNFRRHFHNFEFSTVCRHLLWQRNKTPIMDCFKVLDNIQMVLAHCINSKKIVSWQDLLTHARSARRNCWSRK